MEYPALRRPPRSHRVSRRVVSRPYSQDSRLRGRGSLQTLSSALILIAIVAAALVLYELNMSGRIYPGVRVGGVDVGGLSRVEALDRLRAARDAVGAVRLTLASGGQVWDITPAMVGFSLDVPASIEAAYRLGRNGDQLQRLGAQLQLFLDGRDLSLSGHYSATRLGEYVQAVEDLIDQPPRPAQLAVLPSGRILQTAPQDGRRLDTAGARALIAAALMRGQPATLHLPVTIAHPIASMTAAQRESERLSGLLAERVMVVVAGSAWTMAPSDLASLLRVTATQGPAGMVYADHIDTQAAAAYLAAHVTAFEQPGQDARVQYQNGRVKVVPGRAGQLVDRTRAVGVLANAIEGGADTSVVLPLVNGPTVTNAEAVAVAAHLRRVLRTTVVWLPQRHWAITPAQLAAALTLDRRLTSSGVRLIPHLDAGMLASYLPGSEALATSPAHGSIPAQRPKYAALAAEILAAPPGRAVYHLPISRQ